MTSRGDEDLTWTVEPGPALAVLGPRLAVVLPGGRSAAAARLWVAVDAGAGLDGLVDLLLAEGLAGPEGLDALAVVAWQDDGRVVVLVRGTALRVVVRTGGGTEVVDGAGVRTWVERGFDRVRSVSVLVGEAPEDPARPGSGGAPELLAALGSGLVRARRVARTASDPLGDLPDPAPDASPDPAPDPAPDAVPDPAPDEQPTEAHPAAYPGTGPDDPGTQDAPVLEVSDGRHVVVDRVVVVGRSPEPRDRGGGPAPYLLRLDSPQQEISGTHLDVRPGSGPDAGAAVVTDLGSTNGTVVEHADGAPEALVPGVGLALEPGAVVHVGDGVTLRVPGVQ